MNNSNNNNNYQSFAISLKFQGYLVDLIKSKIALLEQETPINPENKINDLKFLNELFHELKIGEIPRQNQKDLPEINHIDLVSNGEIIKQFEVKIR